MKHKTILMWSLSAVLYLALVIGGYSVYANVSSPPSHGDSEEQSGEQSHEQSHEHSDEPADHSSHGETVESEVDVQVNYTDNIIAIELKDNESKAPQLQVSHEKLMHLIVVSEDLENYYHLHPEDKGNGRFEQPFDLQAAAYKVFVDIKPADLDYRISPQELHVGNAHGSHGANRLQADTDLTKTVNGKTVELSIDSLEAGRSTTLAFDSKNGKPDPYLGALGHVVILDEAGEQFIHVHPASADTTVFNTQFDRPGIYKLWAEFKFGEQVNVYPFVVEVK